MSKGEWMESTGDYRECTDLEREKMREYHNKTDESERTNDCLE
jgi:hypothetical protein